MLPWLLAALLGVGGPVGTLTIQTDDMTATMSSAKDWTLRTLHYDGTPILIDAGGEGVALMVQGGDWQGGGMAREGEQVLALKIDGVEVQELPPGPLGPGTVVEKTSMIQCIRQVATTRFEADAIVQTHKLTFEGDLNLKSFYPFIYSFSPEFTHWLAPGADAMLSGEFSGEGGHPLARAVPWCALYNAAAGKGVIAYFQKPLAGSVTLWDHANYRKFFIQPMVGEVKAGTELEGTLVLACFSAAADAWQETAQQEVAALQQRFPAEQPAPQANQLYDEGVPEHGFLTVQTEHLRTVFQAESAWTLDEIWYDGFKVAGPTGHYGTVLIPTGGNFIGTGHSEGGREVVHSVQMSADGTEMPVTVDTTIEADRFELVKRSTIHKFDATHTITVLGDEIVQRAHLTATEAHELRLMYLFMHCIEPSTTRWVAETPEGAIVEGEFESDKDFELSQKARWVALWFPEQQLAVLLYSTRIPEAPTGMMRLWDQPHYHKFYLQTNAATWALNAGDEVDYTLVFKVVPNETGDWSAVRVAAAELAERFPPVDAEMLEEQ